MTSDRTKDERTRWERLREDVANAGPVIATMWRGARPVDRIGGVLRRTAADDIALALEDAHDAAAEAAIARNPARAGYIEHMARRLVR